MKDFSLILPIHNEEKIIETVFIEIIKTLESLNTDYECILVENGSVDKSLKVINNLAQKYKNTKTIVAPKGYGSAVLAGLKIAKGKYVCYMPSDGQIDLKVFPNLWKIALSGKYDLVKVKRVTRESWVRFFISYAFSMVTSLVFQISIIDINGSPRIFLKKHLTTLNLQYKDSFIDAEFAIKANRLGWRIKEIPMETLSRIGGESTRSWRTFWEFFLNLAKFRLGRDSKDLVEI